jgi:Tfp pilus assembly protein PilX
VDTIGSKPRRYGVLNNERGFALFGVFLTILMMTALGIAAMTMTGLENRMAGFANSTDAAAAAAESCIGTGVNVIMQTLQERQVPLGYVGPAAVIPANAEGAIAPTLTQEIMGQANNNADVSVGAGASPDIQMQSLATSIASTTRTRSVDRCNLRLDMREPPKVQQAAAAKPFIKSIARPH